MVIQLLHHPLKQPPEGALPMQELCHDWHGEALEPAARFALVEDPGHLWLMACRDRAAMAHPQAGLGEFQAGLWQRDVAELFIADAAGRRYLEFNLSPTGAWWLERFSAPRVAEPLAGLPAVLTHGSAPDAEPWQAALGIPLDWLRTTIDWGPGSRLNVCMILDSPAQRFVSACDLDAPEPDFHRPQHFHECRHNPA